MGYLLAVIICITAVLLFIYIKNYASIRSVFGKLLLGFGAVLFSLSVIIYPGQSLNSALEGLKIWFNIVLPSLLPFFIGSRLLVNLGIVSFIGTILEPVMRPIFKVPGCGSFPFVMSITSGYPVGSKIVAELYEKKSCNKIEAQRLLSFCSTSGPLFMVGAVGIGMLGIKECGTVIMLSHYLGALTVGILFRFYKNKYDFRYNIRHSSIRNALTNFKTELNKEKHSFGYLMNDAVSSSMNAMLNIGGFIILFSVIICLLTQFGIIEVLAKLVSLILSPLGISSSFSGPISSGLVEMTIGSKLISSVQAALSQKVTVISAIIAWGGLSVFGQVASMISHTDLKMSVYLAGKVLHMAASGFYAFLIIEIFGLHGQTNIPDVPVFNSIYQWPLNFSESLLRFLTSLFIICGLIIIIKVISTIYWSITR